MGAVKATLDPPRETDVGYSLDIDGIRRWFCSVCGSEIDPLGFCYCRR